MKLWRLPGVFLVRTLVRELRGIRLALETQTALLQRLAAVTAPADPETDPAVVAAETGPSFVDVTDQAIMLEYIERTRRETGHVPTDDEALSYLADEKTRDLHTRLAERDAELERLRSGRHG